MRETDPSKAAIIPVETELTWKAGMPPNELKFRTVYWNRDMDKFFEYEGKLIDVVLRNVPGVKEDYEWLRAIGAIDA